MKNVIEPRRRNGQSGLTIEYVLVMLTLVSAFLVVIFTTVALTSRQAQDYREYVERKEVTDGLGRSFIETYTLGASHDLEAEFGGNDVGIDWTVDGTTLTVRHNAEIVLVVELAERDGEWKVVTYRYGAM